MEISDVHKILRINNNLVACYTRPPDFAANLNQARKPKWRHFYYATFLDPDKLLRVWVILGSRPVDDVLLDLLLDPSSPGDLILCDVIITTWGPLWRHHSTSVTSFYLYPRFCCWTRLHLRTSRCDVINLPVWRHHCTCVPAAAADPSSPGDLPLWRHHSTCRLSPLPLSSPGDLILCDVIILHLWRHSTGIAASAAGPIFTRTSLWRHHWPACPLLLLYPSSPFCVRLVMTAWTRLSRCSIEKRLVNRPSSSVTVDNSLFRASRHWASWSFSLCFSSIWHHHTRTSLHIRANNDTDLLLRDG